MEYLDKAVLLLSCVVEVYILFDFFDNFFERRGSFEINRRIILISIITTGIMFLINLMNNTYLNLFGVAILFFICKLTVLYKLWKPFDLSYHCFIYILGM